MVQRLPAKLNEWQVWDVDAPAVETDDLVGDADAPQISDLQDTVLILSTRQRRWQVEPGSTVALTVTILNNSTRRVAARAYLEGWLDDRWVAEPYVQANLAPGEQRSLDLVVAPPRHPSVEAGDYHVAVVVRSPDEPARAARLGVVLTVLPFDRIVLDPSEFPAYPATWWRRTLTLPVRVANEGNHQLSLRLEGIVAARVGRFKSATSDDEAVTLEPGGRIRILMRLKLQRLPLIALHSRSLPFVLRATSVEDGRVLQSLRSAVEVRPVVGAWQLASLFGLAMTGAVAAVLIAVLGALFLRIGASGVQSASLAPQPAPAIIVVTLNQPVAPMPAAASSGANWSSVDGGATANGVSRQPDPSLPLVLPDQITAPGSGGPVRSSVQSPAFDITAEATGPVVTDASAPADSMTYAQMFQTVGAEYDLDWRMLAAQAYVESGFDALALSNAGAMGLMQVLPGTWREWAPKASVSDPFDSYSNVQVAAIYLDYLRSQLAQRGYIEKEWMLVAYHWGIDRLNSFLTEGSSWQDLPEARRRYAEDILRIAQTLP